MWQPTFQQIMNLTVGCKYYMYYMVYYMVEYMLYFASKARQCMG